MNIPKKLADILMDYIGCKFLCEFPFSQDSSQFLDMAENYINFSFNISWSGGGHTEHAGMMKDQPKSEKKTSLK